MALRKGVRGARRKVTLVLLISALMTALPAAALAASGRIAAVSGAVYFKDKDLGKWAAAESGVPLDEGDRIRTGADGRARMELRDGTSLSIGNDSEIEITEYLSGWWRKKATYTLSTGKIRAVVRGVSGRTDVKVRTPTSVSGVKGTDFIVMNQGRANVVFGESDTVEVSGTGGGTPVGVVPGTMTENTDGTGPIEPVVVEPESPLEEARRELEAVTDVAAPVVWETTGRLPDILARWNINYAHYLADAGRFDEALDVFLIAIDLAGKDEIKADARLGRGTLLSRNLDRAGEALGEYTEVIERYPVEPYLENAVYSAGVISMELGRLEEARGLFKRYLEKYPEGSHRETIELFMKGLPAGED